MKTSKSKVIRNYKDTVFRMLYSDKRELLELYNALNGTNYLNQNELEICTLENAVYMNVKNDVSFIFSSELNLYEQQSTYNPNMPLRNLIYIARQLERYVHKETIYLSRMIRIPVPRFVVFYHGTKEQPERKILLLSDAFEKKVSDPEIELKVLQLNLNYGKNRELLEKCRTLKEYCLFVECVRNYVKKYAIEEAVEFAVTKCIKEGILEEFLRKQRAEVIAMSIFEYHEEEELKKIRADERMIGKAEGVSEVILEMLGELGIISEELQEKLNGECSVEKLKRWLRTAASVSSVAEFEQEIQKEP